MRHNLYFDADESPGPAPMAVVLLEPGMLRIISEITGCRTEALICEEFHTKDWYFVVRTSTSQSSINCSDLEQWFNEEAYDKIAEAAKTLGKELFVKDYWSPLDPFSGCNA